MSIYEEKKINAIEIYNFGSHLKRGSFEGRIMLIEELILVLLRRGGVGLWYRIPNITVN